MSSPTIDPIDRELRKLRDLPRPTASPGFTARALGQLEESAATRALPHRRLPRMAWASVGVLVAVLAVLALRPEAVRSGPADLAAAEARELRRQHALLTEELDRLRSHAEAAAPVLYLGTDDEVDYVLDLSPFLLSPAGGILPASSGTSPERF